MDGTLVSALPPPAVPALVYVACRINHALLGILRFTPFGFALGRRR